MRVVQRLLLLVYFVVATLPLAWMAVTSLKTRDDAISLDARVVPLPFAADDGARAPLTFTATTDGFRRLSHVHVGAEEDFWSYLRNSVFIGLGSTLASVVLGTLAAYGFSRYPIAGAKDWLFFILSTRFLPPLAVVVPILFMYRELDLQGTHLGLILLYTAFNLSLSVWLMKGFIDEIPRAFEEAALVDGYTRLQAFARVILPQARTGMAVTAVFCLISAWNEYGFAMTLNSSGALTVPAYFAGLQGNIDGMPWPQIAAGALIFVAPIVLFTVAVRKHLLRGMTFGTIKQ
ncbi:MAG TPA: carbohydrate ABC transporter permease [Planctomycetota bacterium]|jgi:multiple sugar transport system permease protein|nr:carbohydrate ABC transporter permease [Planctomycetota bacterium]